MTTGFVLDAPNRAICQRAPSEADKLIHHSDRGRQYLSIRYAERLAEAGIDTSVGSVGDSHDNALAESIIGLFKTEVIKLPGPWKSVGQVEWETLKWVDWHHTTRLHSAIGDITPNEAEEAFYATLNTDEKAAQSLNHKLSGKTGACVDAPCFGKHNLRSFGRAFDRTCVRPLNVAFHDATGRYAVRKTGFTSVQRAANARAPGRNLPP